MARHKEDNTSDISKMTQDALLIKVYKKISEVEKGNSESFHSLDKKTSLISQKLESVPTTPEVESMLADHEIRCIDKRKKSDSRLKRPSVIPKSGLNGKATAGIGSLIAGAGVAIGWLLERFLL